jgi:Domain of unknown function (DUF1992)
MSKSGHELLEAQVRAARERGEFENLPGHGKPLQLDDLDHLPPGKRLAALVMRGAGEVSVVVTLVREIRACRALIERSQSASERERTRVTIRDKIAELSAALKSDA